MLCAALAGVAVWLVVGAGPAIAVAPEPVRDGVGGAAAPVPRPADVDDFTFRSMDVDYTLGRDEDGTSTLLVVETFVAEFPQTDQNHGMRRSIPDTYNHQPLSPHLVSITDGDGNARESETDDEDGVFSMTSRAGDFVHGAQTYVFTYTLRNVTWHFPETDDDEFFWDVNGVDWAQPFGRVSATVHIPSDLTGARTGEQSCYRGEQGSKQTCDIAVQSAPDGSQTVTAHAEALQPFQTISVAIGFRSGTFALFDSSYLASPWGWLQGIAGLGMLAAVATAIVVRLRRLRDAPGRGVIIPEYTPPDRIDALQSAVLLGRQPKGIPAEVLEQAVAGSIRILEGGRKAFGGYRLQAQLLDPAKADGDGRMLLQGLFGDTPAPGAIFEFGRNDTRFSTAAQSILRWADAQLTTDGLRRRVSGWTKALPVLLGLACAVLLWILGFAAMNGGVTQAVPVLLMIASVPAFFAVVVLTARKPLTAAGVETRDHLRGLEMFIEWAEADRIRMLQSPAGAERRPIDTNDPRQMLVLYESLLPYAVVFGQERKWADELAVRYAAYGATGVTPYWYVGTHGFDASSFSSGIGSLSAAATSSSSTSGGAGGGGSAGGGGGGGGGGGV
jgi:uncharacterized membrane protein YgcG